MTVLDTPRPWKRAAVALVLAACGAPGDGELGTVAAAAKSDRAPRITTVSWPRDPVHTGDVVALAARAVDADGDSITYAWSASCAGAFSAPDQPQTAWRPFEAVPCTLAVEARAKALSDLARFTVTVQPGAGGTVGVDATFVPWPVVTDVGLGEWTVSRTALDATIRLPAGAPEALDGRFAFELGAAPGALAVSVRDDCGGAAEVGTPWAGSDGLGSAAFRWTRPGGAVLCLLTVEVDHEGLVDALPVSIVSAP